MMDSFYNRLLDVVRTLAGRPYKTDACRLAFILDGLTRNNERGDAGAIQADGAEEKPFRPKVP